MRWTDAQTVVERLRRDPRLWLPALTQRRGFSCSRVEHLLHGLVAAMPADEVYLEVGSLEGRTIEAAAVGNPDKRLIACDPGAKYDSLPMDLPENVRFFPRPWKAVLQTAPADLCIGCAFYDADHTTEETAQFLTDITPHLADEAVVVLDDWDRETVRDAAFRVMEDRCDRHWELLRELPAYGDGLTCPPNHFGWYFGVAVLGFRR